MDHKTFDLIETKADEDGSFVALASVFGNVDAVGDRMLPGSFTKTLEKRRESGKPYPIVFSHDWDDPFKFIGKVDPHQMIETEQGLEVHGQLDLENPTAKQVHKLMKDGTVTGWSFGYKPRKQKRENGANEVAEVELYEVGPTLVGANAEAQLQTVKAINESITEGLVDEVMERRLSSMTPDQFAAQLHALADAIEAKGRTQTSETLEEEAPQESPPREERGPDAEEPDTAKAPRQVTPLERQVRRMLFDVELNR